MNPDNLSETLLGSIGPSSDARDQAERVIRRDRRMVRSLTAATVVLWLLAALGVIVIHFGFLVFFLPKINELLQHPHDPKTASQWEDVVYHFSRLSVPIVSVSVSAMLLAALTTILLVFASRRATLRQIQASLAQISEQLRLIANPSTSPPAPSDKPM